jgi:hypothetical protein
VIHDIIAAVMLAVMIADTITKGGVIMKEIAIDIGMIKEEIETRKRQEMIEVIEVIASGSITIVPTVETEIEIIIGSTSISLIKIRTITGKE